MINIYIFYFCIYLFIFFIDLFIFIYLYFFNFSKEAVEDVQLDGKICVLDIDAQGVKQIKQSSLNPLFVFIKPPSIAELERRLRDRNTETEESLRLRLTAAKEEIEYGEKNHYF